MSPDLNEVLLRTYPEPLRDAYRAALTEHDMSRRHRACLDLVEVGLRLLSSFALSAYGELRLTTPDAKVEDVLSRSQRPSMGHYLGILRQCIVAVPGGVLDLRPSEYDESREASRRFAAAIDAVEEAILLQAKNLGVLLQRHLGGPLPSLDWLGSWNQLVEYRNRAAAHPQHYSWPVDNPNYYESLTPLLEDAVTELLTTAHLRRVFASYPLGTLRSVHYEKSGELSHVFIVDDNGVPRNATIVLPTSLIDVAGKHGWVSNVDDVFILERATTSTYDVVSVLYDLGTRPVPEPLLTTPVPREAAAREDASLPRTGAGAALAAPILPVVAVAAATMPQSQQPVASRRNPETTPLPPQPLPHDLVAVPPGSFAISTSGVTIEVQITSQLLIGRTPVTQSQFYEITGRRPSRFTGDDRPVESVSWIDAVEYCNARSEREGLEPVHELGRSAVTYDLRRNGYRLPTEAEWEFCCRAGDHDASKTLGDMAWYVSNSDPTTHEVAQKDANAFGLYDMLGNVREWCIDWYSSVFPFPSAVDPTGPEDGLEKVLRGGSSTDVAQCVAPSWRQHRADPLAKNEFIGFRLVRRPLQRNGDSHARHA